MENNKSELASESQVERPSQMQNDGKEISKNGNPNYAAEEKLKPIINGIKDNAFNLSRQCEADKAIRLSDKTLKVGATRCDLEGLKVYLGSAEIEYKVSSCVENAKNMPNTFFAIGAFSNNEYYIVSNDEVKKPVFICYVP
jgi:hypothetical protein